MDANKFLSIIFANCKGTVSICRAPDMRGKRFVPDVTPLDGPIYVCISTSKTTNKRDTSVRRRRQDLEMTYMLVLDDIGTKVSRETAERFPPPTYKLITSWPNDVDNAQWGYKLKGGLDPGKAAALLKALAMAGYTDAGATGASRVVRIPGSINDKYAKSHGEEFEAALDEWHPEREFTESEICLGFDILPDGVVPIAALPELPAGKTDPHVALMLRIGIVLGGANSDGWIPIHCPWESEHTPGPGQVHGCDYHPGWPHGHFKCLHSHGGTYHTAHFLTWLLEQQGLGSTLAQPQDEATDTAPTSPQETFQALQEQLLSTGMFPRRPTARSPVQRLAAHLESIQLDANMLPDADRKAHDIVKLEQGTTDPRVHTVMQLIGMNARHNMLTRKTEIAFDNYGALGDEDADAGIEGLIHACRRCGMSNSEAIRGAMSRWSMSHRYSPVAEWICSAPWDGVSRLPALCKSIVMREPSRQKWRDIVVRRWLIQAIAAIRNWEPGDAPEDVGHVMVLQGAQGVGKSRWVASLMPAPWVSIGMTLHLDGHNERDVVYRVTQTPITELGELDGSFKRSDTAATRNFLTTMVDTYRPPYGKRDISRARCTTFIATVNPEGFLNDHTGARRFWPLGVLTCNYEHGIDLQQLWAEAWAIEESGEQFWLTDQEAALHAEIIGGHTAASDVGYIIEDLLLRAKTAEEKDYVHANAKELTTHYRVKGGISVYADLNVELERANFRGAKVKGKRGFYVPNYSTVLSAADRAAFRVITGGLKDAQEPD